MALTVDGNNLIFEGTVTIANFSNPTAGLVTITLTPAGGVGTIPGLVAGSPGLPPTITIPTNGVTTLSPGANATATLTETDAGGEGVASAYTLALGIPQGTPGDEGPAAGIHAAGDLSGTAAVLDTVVVNDTTGGEDGTPTFIYSPLAMANVYNASSISSLSESGQVTANLCSVTVPAQPYNWYPICDGQAVVVGTTYTVVNLEAMLGNELTGNQVGTGLACAGQATQVVSLGKGFGSLVNGTSGYGVVAAGAAATIYFNAVQTAATANSWSIANTQAWFTVTAQPTAAAT